MERHSLAQLRYSPTPNCGATFRFWYSDEMLYTLFNIEGVGIRAGQGRALFCVCVLGLFRATRFLEDVA
jgi:hypothetical protein